MIVVSNRAWRAMWQRKKVVYGSFLLHLLFAMIFVIILGDSENKINDTTSFFRLGEYDDIFVTSLLECVTYFRPTYIDICKYSVCIYSS